MKNPAEDNNPRLPRTENVIRTLRKTVAKASRSGNPAVRAEAARLKRIIR